MIFFQFIEVSNLQNQNENILKNSLRHFKSAFVAIGVFSVFVNLLMLVAPLYMLQLYDRVLTSGSTDTLTMLTVIAVFLLGILALLEIIRSRIMVRIGIGLDNMLNDRVFNSTFKSNLMAANQGSNSLRDMDALRSFFSGNTLFAFFDAPWTPFFIILIFIMHPLLGAIALVGAIAIFALAVATEVISRETYKQAFGYSLKANNFAESSLRNTDVLEAMGMLNAVKSKWHEIHQPSVQLNGTATDRISFITGSTKAVRFMLQIAILGAGGWLALQGEISPGSMIAASIIMGRALAPVEQAIGAWRGFVNTRGAWGRLNTLLSTMDTASSSMPLPRPEGKLEVDKAIVAAPQSNQAIIKSASFNLSAGEVLGLIGPSAAGKTTLGKAMVGVWPALSGSLRLGGINLSTWAADDRGQYIGYLPQDVELFSGTVAENIARFQEIDQQAVMAATNLAECHEMILKLPNGYETEIGQDGSNLSAGQRQRIGLARALYGEPALVVLDEPNSNLDTAGETALIAAIKKLKQQNATVVLITHNIRLLNVVDKVLVLNEGKVKDFGQSDAVLKKYMAPAPVSVSHTQNKKTS